MFFGTFRSNLTLGFKTAVLGMSNVPLLSSHGHRQGVSVQWIITLALVAFKYPVRFYYEEKKTILPTGVEKIVHNQGLKLKLRDAKLFSIKYFAKL